MSRQHKTPAQRAQEALDVANRHVVRLDRKVDQLRTDLAVVEREHTAAVRRRDFLAKHPDLQQHTTTATDTEENHQ